MDAAYPPPPAPTYADPAQPPPPGAPMGGPPPPSGPPPVYSTAADYGLPQQAQTQQPYAAPNPPAYGNQYGTTPYSQQTTTHNTTVVVTQAGRGYGQRGGMYHMPTLQTCSKCGANAMTRVESSLSGQGWCWLILLCVLGCWPWCLLPLCMPGCKTHTHYCSSCNAQVSRF